MEHGATLRAGRREVIDKFSNECAKALVDVHGWFVLLVPCGGRPLAGCRSCGVRQAMPPRICGGCGRALRRRGLANGVRNATACRRVELERRSRAARRTSDLGREEPAYAARISRNMDAFACNSGDSSHATGPSRTCICTCGESEVRMSGMSGSLSSTGGGGKHGDGSYGAWSSRVCSRVAAWAAVWDGRLT